MQLAPVVVNAVLPTLQLADPDRLAAPDLDPDDVSVLRAAADFRVRRQQLQDQQLQRLAELLPLPRLRLPFLFTSDIGPAEIATLADALAGEIDNLP